MTKESRRTWFAADDIQLEDFRAVVEQVTDPADHWYADSVEHNVPIYGDGAT